MVDPITIQDTAQHQPSPQVAQGLDELEALLCCYRGVADPISYLTARRAVDELRLEVASARRANLRACTERAERLASALARAVCEWVMDREG